MTREILFVFAALISLFYFPWPLTVVLTLVAAVWVPFLPLMIGMLADALYLAPGLHSVPLYTLLGAVVTGFSYFVRSRLKTGIIA